MNASDRLIINAVWDDEARIWAATSDDVPGFATEADDMEVLVEKLTRRPPTLFSLLTVLSPCETIHGVSELFEDKVDEKLAGIVQHIPLPNRHGNQTSIAKG